MVMPTEVDDASSKEEQAAELYAEQVRAFQMHASMFALGMVIIVTANLLTNLAADTTGDWRSWWSAWAFLGWGAGIAVHGLVVRLNRPPSSPDSTAQVRAGLAGR